MCLFGKKKSLAIGKVVERALVVNWQWAAFLWLELDIIPGTPDVIQVRKEGGGMTMNVPTHSPSANMICSGKLSAKGRTRGTHEEVNGEVALGHGCRGKLGARHDRHIARGLAQTARPAVVQCQPLNRAKKLPSSGPTPGTNEVRMAQTVIPYTRLLVVRSATVAPPMARIRELMDPMRSGRLSACRSWLPAPLGSAAGRMQQV